MNLRQLFFVGLAAMAFSGVARAQTSTGTVRGYVKDPNGQALGGAQIEARNTETGVQRAATARTDGSYILPGLAPGTYDVSARNIGSTPQRRQVVVQIGATLIVDFALQAGAVELQAVTVQGAPTLETRTSEVATNVTPQQIERLPTPSRNFLDLATLAPGLSVTEDRMNGTSRTFSAGGQSPNSANIFVDGTSLKNDLTQGGVSGQDASRGNPFPRSAIQEYRVITQNFKAEYQKSASAVITATTRSGGNTWSGNATFSYQNKDLVVLDTFQRRDKHIADSIAQANGTPSTFSEPDYARYLTSLSIGGPIQRDRLFFFGSYEGNYQNRANVVSFDTLALGRFPALDTVNVLQYNGSFTSPFRETLLFGKLTYAIDAKSSADLSLSTRHETDIRDFGTRAPGCPATTCAFTEAINFRQDVAIAQFRHNYFSGAWLNEAKIDYSRFRRNPGPNTPGLAARVYSYKNTDNYIGSNLSTQDFIQKRLGFRDDLTYSGKDRHVFKTGASIDFVTYDVFKGNDETPRFAYRDSVNGQSYAFRNPYELRYGTGNAALNKSNAQIGAYLQDDWSPTPRLTISAGIRWDFESNMMNYDYVTPQMVVDTLTRYNDSLPTPLDLNRYISNGNSRKPFYGAFQPRLGFSYALDDNNITTIFGGWGIYYDRSLFDVSVDETLKLTHPTYTIQFAHPDSTPGPGQEAWNDSYLTANKATLDALVGTLGRPEAWLIDSKAKVPKSRQWNLGIRRVVGAYLITATYAGVRGVDQLTLNWANFGLNPNGSCCTSFNIAAHGFSNFIYSSNEAKTWYDALQVRIDRPYRQSGGKFNWGGGLTFSYATRSLEGVDGLGDLFAFPNTINIPKHPSNDENIRVVINWMTDVPYLAGVQFSGVLTGGTGNRQDVGCPVRFCGAGYVRGGFAPRQYGFLIPGGYAYRMVDLRLRKDFPYFSGTSLAISLDLFNAFNYQNFGCYHTGSLTAPDLGKADCVVSDPRRLQIGADYSF
jgi:hypothetical protein